MSVFASTTYLGDGSDIQNAVDELEVHGIFYVEIGSNHAYCDIKTLKLHPNTEYIIHNYFPARDQNFVLNLGSEDKEVRKKSIYFIKNTIKICQRLNIKYYTIHPGFLAEASINPFVNLQQRNFDFKFKKSAPLKIRQKIIGRVIRIIKDLYDFAQDRNVCLLIENEGSKTSSNYTIFAQPKELEMLKRSIGKGFKFNFNLAHATLAGIDLEDAKIFYHFYKDATFFEVSEINGIFDSHLPILEQQPNKISRILIKHAKFFSKKNVILEYRNINIKEVEKSYKYVTMVLNSGSPGL